MADGKPDFLQGPSAFAAGAQRGEPVPAYGHHIVDDLYSEPFSRLEAFADIVPDTNLLFDNINEHPSPEAPPLAQNTLPGHDNAPRPSSPTPLMLTLDKDLIFPHPPPSTALYSLSYTLVSRSSSLTFRRSIPSQPQKLLPTANQDGTPSSPRPAKAPSDKDLYDTLRTPLIPTSFILQGERKSTFPGTGELRFVAKRMSFSGKGAWECRFGAGKGIVLKSTGENDKWVDGTGKLVAKQVGGSRSGKRSGQDDGGLENALEIVPGIDEMLLDLVVCCWIARSWYEQTVGFTASTRAGDRQIRREERRK